MLRVLVLLSLVLLLWADRPGHAEPITTGAFSARPDLVFIPGTGPSTAAFALSYPGNSVSEPGQYAAWPLVTPSPGRDATIAFTWRDSFTGPTAGYHVLQLLAGEKLLWESDVAGGDLQPRPVRVSLARQDQPAARTPLTLTFRLFEKKQVTNFAVQVQVAEPTLHVGDKALPLMERQPVAPVKPWPDDLPLPSLPIIGDWTWQANIVQPWGRTQTVAIKEAATWAPRFAREHGLNAMIVLPPRAHNAITDAFYKQESPHHVTEEEFRAALDLYRREGLRLILYSSIMHMGHDPAWQFGEIAKTHPEWAMRDRDRATVNTYGNPWLCPSTGALQATIDYTAELVRQYQPDAVMLDNNEFMATDTGLWTCHCDGCQQRFAGYLQARFGADIPGVGPTAGRRIPLDEGDLLWGLWLSWRNRTWAEACEAYRTQLRRIKPDLVLLANTQYQYRNGLLAVDGQYAHLDAVLSESRGLSVPQMAAKMLLGRALAAGRPLWNYIGTFEEKDFKRLRPPEEVAGICAASEAAGANPWIVFYGFTGEANQPSLQVVRRYTDFWRENADLLGSSSLLGDIGVLISTESRDLAGTALQPPLMMDLLSAGVCVRPLRAAGGLRDTHLTGLRAVSATGCPCLHEITARALAAYVRGGGTLIISPETAWRDEYGRWRNQSALSQALGTDVTTVGEYAHGKGRVLCVADDAAALAAAQGLAQAPVTGAGPVITSRLATHTHTVVLSIVGVEGPPDEVKVRLPDNTWPAELRMPGHKAQRLSVDREGSRCTTTCHITERLGLIVCQQDLRPQ